MKVEDLHKTKIVTPEVGWTELSLEANGEACVSVWSIPNEGEFDSPEEALKAAALFRASHEMQKALIAVVAWLEEGGAKGQPLHRKCVATLELSRKTDNL